jgi:hypothetical protein
MVEKAMQRQTRRVSVSSRNQSTNKSISVASVAMTSTEEFKPAMHQKLLGLVVVFDHLMLSQHAGC